MAKRRPVEIAECHLKSTGGSMDAVFVPGVTKDDLSMDAVRQSMEVYLETGEDYLQVAFGCHGGHHRSVYLAERLAERLAGTEGVEIEVRHTARQYWDV